MYFLSWSCEVVVGNYLHSELFNGELITPAFRIYLKFLSKTCTKKATNLSFCLILAARIGKIDSFEVELKPAVLYSLFCFCSLHYSLLHSCAPHSHKSAMEYTARWWWRLLINGPALSCPMCRVCTLYSKNNLINSHHITRGNTTLQCPALSCDWHRRIVAKTVLLIMVLN